jgi:MGT family glycosyltransferase
MHFGIISPPVSGHLHPFGALGRELIARGHAVTVFHMPDLAAKVRNEGLDFVPIGVRDWPPGTLPASLAKLGALDGLAALRFTIAEIAKTTRMLLREAPAAIRAAGIQALLVDQTEPAGDAISEHLEIPFITVCNALLLNGEPSVPPAFGAWRYGTTPFHRLRNRIGYAMSRRALKPVMAAVNEARQGWGLCAKGPEETHSRLAQISQQPPAFDYPRQQLPPGFHYTGPLRRAQTKAPDFPWERLDGRPIVYASLGTLQNGKERVFRAFAEACEGLPVQLVMTHGGGLDERAAASFPGSPLVVGYAPQLDILKRASLTLTHAGLNTMLDSLSCGVPLVAVPITYEQPAIARRMDWCGVGKTIRFRSLSTAAVRRAIEEVLATPSYRENALRLRQSIAAAGGVTRAADIVERALC